MEKIRSFLLTCFVAGCIVSVTGITFRLIGADSSEFLTGVFIGGALLAAVAIVSWLTISIGSGWLENKGLIFVTTEENVLHTAVKLFGVTIATVRFVYNHPIKVVRKGNEYDVTPL